MSRRTLLLVFAALAAAAPAAVAQEALDRSVRPAPARTPTVRTPEVTRFTLRNGLAVHLVRRPGLPLVNARLVVRAGAVQDGERAGLAQVTGALLDEGAGGKDAVALADALEALGAQLAVSVQRERTDVTLQALAAQLEPAFGLMADVVARPALAAEELERERKRRLQAIRQQKDQPTVVATEAFLREVYGADHPYGRPAEGTEASVAAITRDDVAAFYATWYRPNNAFLVVTGDLTEKRLAPVLERAFAGWAQAPVPAAAQAVPPRPAPAPTRVLLIDKPGAAQSEIRVGHAGAARLVPDYHDLLVLNAALGGAFTSRINLNLRERRGFTYGARSAWDFARGDGAFVASAGVFTAKTDSALAEFVRELRDAAGARPFTEEETAYAEGSLVRQYPLRLETGAQVTSLVADLAFFELPASEIAAYPRRLEAVTPATVARAAARIEPSNLAIVVVGDVAKIRPGIEALGLGPVEVRP